MFPKILVYVMELNVPVSFGGFLAVLWL